jgi:magnesium chelatase subunit I
LIAEYEANTCFARRELESARDALPEVELSEQAEQLGLDVIQDLGIESLRSEITLFEAARAHAVADGRKKATVRDVHRVAPLALRLRRSSFIDDYFSAQAREEEELERVLNSLEGPMVASEPPENNLG